MLLIGQRKANDRHAFKWEFPGGKVEPGETAKEALERELEEELAIQAHVGPELIRYEYSYANRPPILLIFHRISDFQGEPRSEAFQQIRWEQPGALVRYDFLDGDADFVRRLAAGEWFGNGHS
jgi:8-oxo-dGTP diphosphatase